MKWLSRAARDPYVPCRFASIVGGRTAAEADAKIVDLLANGTAGPGDFFIRLLSLKADPKSAMHYNHRWDEAAGRWVRKDGRDDAAIARDNAQALACARQIDGDHQ